MQISEAKLAEKIRQANSNSLNSPEAIAAFVAQEILAESVNSPGVDSVILLASIEVLDSFARKHHEEVISFWVKESSNCAVVSINNRIIAGLRGPSLADAFITAAQKVANK